MVRERHFKLVDLLSMNRSLVDAQLDYVLVFLRSYAVLPKFMHVMRTRSPNTLGLTLVGMGSLLQVNNNV